MAFFKSEKEEYFSLSTAPLAGAKSYLYLLSESQARAAKQLIPFLFWASVIIFLVASTASCFDFFDGTGNFLCAVIHEKLNIVLTCFATVLAYCQFAFFGWIRNSQKHGISEIAKKRINNISLNRRLSYMTYLAILLDMSVPLVSIIFLPATLSSFIDDMRIYGTGFQLLVSQLAFVYILLFYLLAKNIIAIYRTSQVKNNS